MKVLYAILLILLYPIAAAIVSLYTYDIRITVIFSSLTYLMNLIITTMLLFQPDHIGMFYIDFVTKIFLLIINGIFLAMIIYSSDYIKHIDDPYLHPRYFFMLSNLFAVTLLFSVVINSTGLLWVGIGASTATSALLVVLEEKSSAFEATWRYIIIVSAGLAISLISIALVYHITGTEALNVVPYSLNGSNRILAQIALVLALIGFGTKFGLFPISTWLPDVHGEAPAPVSALFSAILLPVALYGFMSIYGILYPVSSGFSTTIIIYAGVFSALLSSMMFLAQIKYKRLIAYSSMENMSIALIGIALGYYGLIASLIIISAHSFAKSSAFFSAGNIKIETDESVIEKASEIGIPSTVTKSFALATMSVTGTPPFGIFFGEFLILYLLVEKSYFIPVFMLIIVMAISFLSMLYHSVNMMHSTKKTEKITLFMEYLPICLLVISIVPAILWVRL